MKGRLQSTKLRLFVAVSPFIGSGVFVAAAEAMHARHPH